MAAAIIFYFQKLLPFLYWPKLNKFIENATTLV